jgi:uncharacterized protein (TIGR02118 family)
MIKATVMYPNSDDAKFDHDYYINKHIPMIQEKMGEHVIRVSVDKGMGGEPGQPAPYVCMCHIYVESLEAFQAAFVANMEAIGADVPNYTNIKPALQISEVIIE